MQGTANSTLNFEPGTLNQVGIAPLATLAGVRPQTFSLFSA
jgi:hypothetical protein